MHCRSLYRICASVCASVTLAIPISVSGQDITLPNTKIIGNPAELPGAKEIYRQSCNSVVQIQMSDLLGSTLVTGFFVDDKGLIATVISTNRSPDTITVTWQERTYPAELLAIDQRTRLALVKIDAKMTPALMLSRGLDSAIGSQLYAVSDTSDTLKRISPGRLAGRESTLQKSALPTTILRLHMSAAPDAFGAPVLDSDGKVAAVLLLNFDQENEVCFALPSEILRKAWADYQKFGRVEPAWCGFTLELGTTTPKIIYVQADSPAAAAGFLPGDVILRIADHSVLGYQDVVDRCYYLQAGEDVNIGILRGKSDRTLTLKPRAVSTLKPAGEGE
ncbi:MAG: serine protease Do [Verrucomicrobiales bacterium]|jgi:serine protease Do